MVSALRTVFQPLIRPVGFWRERTARSRIFNADCSAGKVFALAGRSSEPGVQRLDRVGRMHQLSNIAEASSTRAFHRFRFSSSVCIRPQNDSMKKISPVAGGSDQADGDTASNAHAPTACTNCGPVLSRVSMVWAARRLSDTALDRSLRNGVTDPRLQPDPCRRGSHQPVPHSPPLSARVGAQRSLGGRRESGGSRAPDCCRRRIAARAASLPGSRML